MYGTIPNMFDLCLQELVVLLRYFFLMIVHFSNTEDSVPTVYRYCYFV
jgi:hypothetical protein